MKNLGTVSATAAVLLSSAVHLTAIEKLKLSLQGSNAVLSWPSRTGEVYIVRYRLDPSTNTSWVLLTNALDGNGNSVLVNHGYFDLTVSYNPSYTYRVWVFFEDDFVNGNWLIAYLKGIYSPIHEVQLDNAMQQMSDFAGEEGLAWSPYLQITTGPADWAQMLNILTAADTRNLYYWGHGGPSALGYGSNDPNNGLKAWQLRAGLGNILVTNEIQIRHAFRFVWLDGCHTASKSSDWPRTFGITPVQLDAQEFLTLGGGRRAFLGWKKTIATAVFDTTRFTFAQNFFENWISTGQTLQNALNNAAVGTIGASERSYLQVWGDLDLPKQGHFP